MALRFVLFAFLAAGVVACDGDGFSEPGRSEVDPFAENDPLSPGTPKPSPVDGSFSEEMGMLADSYAAGMLLPTPVGTVFALEAAWYFGR